VCYRYTVKPVYKGHSRVAENVPVYKGFNYIHYSLLGKISLPFIDSDLLLKKKYPFR
jgi:hypothetical protein